MASFRQHSFARLSKLYTQSREWLHSAAWCVKMRFRRGSGGNIPSNPLRSSREENCSAKRAPSLDVIEEVACMIPGVEPSNLFSFKVAQVQTKLDHGTALTPQLIARLPAKATSWMSYNLLQYCWQHTSAGSVQPSSSCGIS